MAGGRQIPADVIDLREYKKNNQVRDIKNLVIQPFVAEANTTYLLGALPKGAAVTAINKFTDTKVDAVAATDADVKIGDINDSENGNSLKNNTIYPNGGDIFIIPTGTQKNGYIISYMNTDITDGAYAG